MRIQQELNYNRYILEERDKMIQVCPTKMCA
jgi:hypothetical protein